MKKHSNLLLVFLFTAFIFSNSQAQLNGISVVKGSVIDNDTGNPLEAASVYFTQTTIGTTVKKSGQFVLEVSKPGNYELIVSMVGYEMQRNNIYIEPGKEYKYQFKLIPKVIALKAVEIVGEDMDAWRKNLEIFKFKFLGDLAAADSCTMYNLEYLNFEWKGGFLIAETDRPITVINKFLGYKIICELLHFEFNVNTSVYACYFIPMFIELIPENQAQKNVWLANRKLEYLGSPEHFLKSLRNNRLDEEGYKVYHVTGIGNYDQRLIKIVENWEDIKYEGRVFDDPAIFFENYLRIKYKNIELSYVYQRYDFFTIDQNGIADNHPPFIYFGFWTKNGVSNLLPRDYLPENKWQNY